MLSDKVKNQYDYKVVMNMIEKMLNTNGPQGSISFGKYYAAKYKDMFNNMLSGDVVNFEILDNALTSVDEDLREVRNDCRRRIRSTLTDQNDYMMSMITDFVKSM
jgi:predicted restriction endonuclease